MSVKKQECELTSLVEQAEINQIDLNSGWHSFQNKEDDVNVLNILRGFNDKSEKNLLRQYSFKELVKITTSMDLEGDSTAYKNPHRITRIPWSNQSKIDKYCKKSVPIIIENCQLVQHSIDVWTMDVLEEKFGETNCTVFESDSDYFLYWNSEKKKNLYDLPFKKPSKTTEMTFKYFRSEANSRLDQLSTKIGKDGKMPDKKCQNDYTCRIHLMISPRLSQILKIGNGIGFWKNQRNLVGAYLTTISF